MEKSTDTLQKAFGAIIDSVGFAQFISGPMHIVDLNVFPHNPGLPSHYVCIRNKYSEYRNQGLPKAAL